MQRSAMQEAQQLDLHGTPDRVQEFHDQLLEDIRSNRIILPSIPDIVLKIREVIHDPDSDLNMLVKVISTDAAISARILKVANSSLYRRSTGDSDNLRAAISRLGTSLVNTLVTNLAIIQTLRCPKGPVTEHLERLFRHSTQVAAIAYALAKSFTKINPEQAMLAGMVHDIGHLPILQKAVCQPKIWSDSEYLNLLLKNLHAPVGGFILKSWGFSQEMIDTAIKHEQKEYINPQGMGLLDLVMVADLLSDRHRNGEIDSQLMRMPAFTKLGIDLKKDIDENQFFQSMVSEVSAFFQI